MNVYHARFVSNLSLALLAFGISRTLLAQTSTPPATSLHYRWANTASQRQKAIGIVAPRADASSWTAAASYPVTVARYGAAQNGNSLYVVSGFSNGVAINHVRRYDVATNTWTSLASIPAATEAPVAVYYDGKIYEADGYGNASQNLLRIYDVVSDSWSAGPVRPGVTGSYGAAIAAYANKIYIVGGLTEANTTVVSIYDIASGTWSVGPTPPMPVYFAGYKQIGQYLYVAGGFTPSPDANGTTTMRYDLVSGTWTIGPLFTPQRGDFAMAASGTKLYAIGGDANGGDYFTPSSEVDELDTATWPNGTWVVSPDALPVARQAQRGGFFTDAITGGEIWSTGGFAPGDAYLSDHLYRNAPPPSPTPTPSPTATPTPPPTPTPTPVPTPTPTPPAPLSAVSRKAQGSAGSIDLFLPLAGTPTVEPRSGGPTNDFQIVVNFGSPISVLGSPQASVTLGSATVGSGGIANAGTVSISGSSVAIPLTNVANGQTVYVKLNSVSTGGVAADVTVPIRFLVGDVNGDATVNSADFIQVLNHSGQSVDASNFRYDINADGMINSADAVIAKSASGTSVHPAAPLSAVSRKTHGFAGNVDVPLPLSGASGIECRSGGLTSDYEIVVQFPVAITVTGSPQASIQSGSARIGTAGITDGGAVSVSGTTVVVPLTSVANAQALTIFLNDVSDGNGIGAIEIPMRILIGDSNADGGVNSADAAQIRNHSGQSVTGSTFRYDLNADGLINSADASIARAASGSGLPAPTVLSAVSRKVHGTAGELDIPLPLIGTAGVDCRSGGLTNDYEMVVTFGQPVSLTGSPQASVTSGSALIGSGGFGNGGNVTMAGSALVIPLTNVANAQTINVLLRGVTDGNAIGDINIPMSVLIGDVNGDGAVNSADASRQRSNSGQPVTVNSLRSDINADGAINSADAQLVRSHTGTSLP